MPTKDERRAQIAARPLRDQEDIRDDAPRIREALLLLAMGGRDGNEGRAWLAGLLGVKSQRVIHAQFGHYVRLPDEPLDGKPASPRQRLDFFMDVGDVTALEPAEGGRATADAPMAAEAI